MTSKPPSARGILLALPFFFACQPSQEIEGISQTILGGQAATVGQFPSVVALAAVDGQGNLLGLCTGTLVEPDKVLTAAHCVNPGLLGLPNEQAVADSTLVIFDSVDIFNPNQGFAVQAAQVIGNSAFNLNNLGSNDIGVVILETPVTDRAPSPIDTDPNRNFIGTSVTLVGYGVTQAGNQGTAGREFFLADKTVSDCSLLGLSNNLLLCFNQADGKGSCSGDSGGPAFADINGVPTVVGVTSFGDQNCAQFGAYTRVSAELDFVNPLLDGGGDDSCQADGACEAGCGLNDPDCLSCGADGACTAGCGENGNAVDPDCDALDCSDNGFCTEECGLSDPDCFSCVPDGGCQQGCGENGNAIDPDCDANGFEPTEGCSVGAAPASDDAPALLVLLSLVLGAFGLIRRRQARP